MASKFRVPIVPVYLEGLDANSQYNFDTARSLLVSLADGDMDAASAASLVAATGTTVHNVGNELARCIPNLISKPLSVKAAESSFESQMQDVELSLRRALSLKGRTLVAEGVPSKRAEVGSAQPQNQRALPASTGFDMAKRSTSPRSSTPEKPNKRANTPPRVIATRVKTRAQERLPMSQ